MLRNIMKTSPIILGAVSVQKTTEKEIKSEDSLSHYQCKPSDLPLYKPLHEYNKPKLDNHPSKSSPTIEAIENTIGNVRVEVTTGYNAIASKKKNFDDIIATGKEHSKVLVDYLNEPDNTMPRVGAIAIGGLSGLIFALRGGFIRRIVYTSIGAGAIASMCYPEEAGKYGQIGLVEAKKSVTVAYNFIFGIKPTDDIKTRDFFPKFPTNISDISESMSDLVKSAKDALWSPKK